MPFNPVKPDASLYGVIPQIYAQSLASPTGDPTADAINRINLGYLAQGGGGIDGYGDLIREANQYGMDAARLEEQTKLDTGWMAQLPNLIKAGAGGAVRPGGHSGYDRDDRAIREADAGQIQAQQAENVSKLGPGVKALTEAGIEPPTNYIRGVLTPPQAAELIEPIRTGYLNPSDKSNRMKAEADQVQAAAATMRAKNGEGKSEPKETTKTTYIIDGTGRRVPISTEVTTKGGHAAPAPAVAKVEPKYIPDPKNTRKLIRNPAYKGP